MSTRSQLVAAAKAGAWAEFLGERLYNRYAARRVERTFKNMRLNLRRAMRRRPRRPIYIRPRRRLTVKRARASARTRESKRVKFSSTNIGNRVGTNTVKWAQVADITGQLVSRTLTSAEITDVSKTTTNAINERQRNIINCRGFTLQGNVRNYFGQDAIFHLAILHPRNASLITTTDFFRSHGGTERNVDFSTSLSGTEFANYPINTGDMVVLRHYRMRLTPGITPATGFQSQYGSSYRNFSFYVPLKRQLEYEDNLSTNCNHKVFLTYWIDYPSNLAGQITQAGCGYLNLEARMCFNEPQN